MAGHTPWAQIKRKRRPWYRSAGRALTDVVMLLIVAILGYIAGFWLTYGRFPALY